MLKTNNPPSHGSTAPSGQGPPNCRGFTITLRHTTLGRTPLESIPTHRPLTTHNTHKRQTSKPPAGFEHAVPASERPQMRTLDRVASGIGKNT
jgi:hypothetical protein